MLRLDRRLFGFATQEGWKGGVDVFLNFLNERFSNGKIGVDESSLANPAFSKPLDLGSSFGAK